jgi:hypothetical protein
MFGHVWVCLGSDSTDPSQRCDMNKLLPQNLHIIRDIMRDGHRLLPQKLVLLLYIEDSESVFDLPSLIEY